MLPLDIQSTLVNSIPEEKWQRFNEWQARERLMSSPRIPLRQRFMRASGEKLIALGRRMQQSAGMSLANELTTAS